MKNKKIALIGLGYVGLPLAVEFGKKREIIGFDRDEKRPFQNYLEKRVAPSQKLSSSRRRKLATRCAVVACEAEVPMLFLGCQTHLENLSVRSTANGDLKILNRSKIISFALNSIFTRSEIDLG